MTNSAVPRVKATRIGYKSESSNEAYILFSKKNQKLSFLTLKNELSIQGGEKILRGGCKLF
jgi:hypothetical protein